MSTPPKKPTLNETAAVVEDGKPLTPIRTDGPTNTVIVAEEVDPRAVKTSAMPAWPTPEAASAVPLTTQPTPAWSEGEQPVANPRSIVTEPTPAWEAEVSSVPTRAVAVPSPNANEATRVELAPVVSEEVRQAVTRPTRKPGALSKPIKLGLVGAGTLSLIALLWLFGRSDTVKDPSRPVPISKLPIIVEKPVAPLPEKHVDVTPILAKPEAPKRPPLTMELTLDAGAGLPPLVKSVPASIVRIETEPMVSVSWNGDDFGWTPALITMPVGQNVITVENKEVGLKKSMTITASDEERTFLRYEFAKGWLSVDRPASAKVSVGGVAVQKREVLLWEGRHRVDVVFRNGQKESKVVDVVRGTTAELFFDEPLPQE